MVCSQFICHATALTQQPLSTYRWPRRRPSVLEWLDSCVQDAVRQLDHAPFVQLVYSERAHSLETHRVPRTATGPSEVRSSSKVNSLLSTYLLLFAYGVDVHVPQAVESFVYAVIPTAEWVALN